ncbi:MAG: hypothetical protein E7420_02540 [Ruminococcaceae bacterium]|nr:hypothetical protein [Oscillospiraceae bacterium]
MSAIFGYLSGMAHIRIKGLIPESFLNSCADAAIELASIRRIDKFTAELKVHTGDIEPCKNIAKKCFCDLTVLSSGKEWIRTFRRKILPVIFMISLIGLVFWSKFYVWEIELKGNKNIPDGEILCALSECGVGCGSFWPGFSADSIRSKMLYRIPELSWITVNMHGSLAEVIIVERKSPPEMIYENECSNIISDKDAFIMEINTLEGKSVVKSGDAVKKGDILISGIVESSYSPPRFLHSLGSIKAETNNIFSAIRPSIKQKRIATGEKSRKYALIIGNKRINFYSSSSISDSFCDKIISVWSPEIKGLIKLPLSIVKETSCYYTCEEYETDYYVAAQELEYCLREELSREIKDGEILGEKLNFSKNEGLIISTLRVRCVENIGRTVAVSEDEIAQSKYRFSQKADDE